MSGIVRPLGTLLSSCCFDLLEHSISFPRWSVRRWQQCSRSKYQAWCTFFCQRDIHRSRPDDWAFGYKFTKKTETWSTLWLIASLPSSVCSNNCRREGAGCASAASIVLLFGLNYSKTFVISKKCYLLYLLPVPGLSTRGRSTVCSFWN